MRPCFHAGLSAKTCRGWGCHPLVKGLFEAPLPSLLGRRVREAKVTWPDWGWANAKVYQGTSR